MLTKKQFELHNTHITGSKIASILEIPGAFKSKYQLFCEMHGDVALDNESTIRMRMGNYMEDGIANYCEQELKWRLRKLPDDAFIKHPKFSFIGGIPDRERLDKKLVPEFKMVDSIRKKEWKKDDIFPYSPDLVVPDYYLTQIYLYMSIFDMPGVVVVVFGGNDPEVIEVPRNPTVENFIIEKCVKFWDDLQNDQYPEVDGSKTCTETLKRLYPDNNDVMLLGDSLNDDLMTDVIKYEQSKDIEKQAKTDKAMYGNRLKLAINENEGILWNNGSKITYKKCKDGEKFNEKLFESENPALYSKYLMEKKGHRTLRVNLKGELQNEQ